MRYVLSIVVTALLGVTSNTAFAYGHTGHEVVGAIADQLLTPNAAKKVKEIGGMNLRAAAKWPDCAKDVMQLKDGSFKYQPDPKYRAPCKEFEPNGGIARMEDYVKRNWDNCKRDARSDPCHKQYHYSDVAVEHDQYDRSYAGTSDHDIVSSINAAGRCGLKDGGCLRERLVLWKFERHD